MSSPAPIRRLAGLTYDVVTRRYRRANGRFLSTDDVLGVLEKQIVATGESMRALAGQLQTGQINLAQWQLSMERSVKTLHLASAAIERGGFQQLNGSDLGWVGREVRRQYEFLANFAREIESGKQALDGRLLARVDMYAQAGRSTQREMARRLARLAGAAQERRQLGPSDHCPTCLSQAAKGWRPIGTLKRIGDSECRSRCRCEFLTRTREQAAA